jgi:hypothetical protein
MDTEAIRAITDLLRVAKGTDAEAAACRIVEFAASPMMMVPSDDAA